MYHNFPLHLGFRNQKPGQEEWFVYLMEVRGANENRLPWAKNDGNLRLGFGKPFRKSNMEQKKAHVYYLDSIWEVSGNLTLGFACSVLGKSSKNNLPNGGIAW